jgi:hypothetical protein
MMKQQLEEAVTQSMVNDAETQKKLLVVVNDVETQRKLLHSPWSTMLKQQLTQVDYNSRTLS